MYLRGIKTQYINTQIYKPEIKLKYKIKTDFLAKIIMMTYNIV